MEESGRHVAETASKRLRREGERKEADAEKFEIVSVDSRTFERDPEGDRCKFSWKIVVQSHATRPLVLKANLEFVDMDSYLVEEDSASGFKLDPGARGKFRGTSGYRTRRNTRSSASAPTYPRTWQGRRSEKISR